MSTEGSTSPSKSIFDFENYGDIEYEDFHKDMSVHDATYSDLFSDDVFKNEEWCIYNYNDILIVSLYCGLGRVEEGIHHACKLLLPGKAYPDDQLSCLALEVPPCQH